MNGNEMDLTGIAKIAAELESRPTDAKSMMGAKLARKAILFAASGDLMTANDYLIQGAQRDRRLGQYIVS